MSIINEALKKTQQSRKMDKDKRAQVKTKPAAPAPAPSRTSTPTSTLKAQPIQKKSEPVKKIDLLFTWRMASFLTVTALLVILAVTNYERVTKKSVPYMQVVSKPLSKSLNKVKVAFEGVLVSNHSKIALINKQSLHLGDSVNGMKIIAIEQDTVDLQGDNGTIKLRAGATYLL